MQFTLKDKECLPFFFLQELSTTFLDIAVCSGGLRQCSVNHIYHLCCFVYPWKVLKSLHDGECDQNEIKLFPYL